MKKRTRGGLGLLVLMLCFLFCGMTALAEEEPTIQAGIYAESRNLEGLTADEARANVESYVVNLMKQEITLVGANGTEVKVTPAQFKMTWANPEIIDEAISIGTEGNVIQRYKALKDLEHEKKVYPIQFKFDMQAINDVLLHQCAVYDQKAVNVSLKRENGEFIPVEGQTGYMVDIEASIDRINDYLTQEWDHKPCRISLEIIVDEPKGSVEELAQITDVIGSFTTSYKSSGSSRRGNVENGCALINGTFLYSGEEFSTYDTVAPFTAENGYYLAGSYVNGKVVDSLGGGICQVSTTLYNAVLNAELEVTERHNHSMIVSYVDPSADAAIAESAGKDFRFVNNTDTPIYIEGITKDRKITFNIYGKETRSENRKVRYESEVTEVINPPNDTIIADPSQPIGYIVADSSAHIGYKSKLWKVVTENGVQVSRTQVNSSNYKMVPRSATVGTATSDPHAYEEIMAAIGTGSIDHVKNVIAILTAPPAGQ